MSEIIIGGLCVVAFTTVGYFVHAWLFAWVLCGSIPKNRGE